MSPLRESNARWRGNRRRDRRSPKLPAQKVTGHLRTKYDAFFISYGGGGCPHFDALPQYIRAGGPGVTGTSGFVCRQGLAVTVRR